MLIYKWTNKINNKIYIGQTTKTLQHRTRMHNNSANIGSSTPLHNAIRKYGLSNFIIEQVCTASSIEELNELESKLIKEYNSLSPSGYNLKLGGHFQIWHPEMKAKASVKAKERMSKDNGQQFQAVQKKGRAALKNKPPWNKGKKATEEAKLNQAKAHIGQVAWNRQAIECIETGEVFESLKKAAECLKLSASKICLVLKKQRKHTGGYTFKYTDKKAV